MLTEELAAKPEELGARTSPASGTGYPIIKAPIKIHVEVLNASKVCLNSDHGESDNGSTKPISFASVFKEKKILRRWALIEASLETALMDSLVVAIALQNGPGHTLEMIDTEYELKSHRCDTCKIFDHNDDQCPQKVKLVNVNSEASTPQPNVNKEPSNPKPNNKGTNFEVNNETWKASNDVGSIMDDSDSEEVKNVFVEDNEKHIDDLVDDARKKVAAPPKKTSRKTSIWDDDIGHAAEEVEHDMHIAKMVDGSYCYWHFL
ncbi:hypothetical protein Tco_0748491 [Tanacetum coccineum]|uniref:Zinc knuckle CX2CX4HX4C n=1 Tax=Tanacetum coccineum TaxID=301880 RepID=A0ABQ4YWQ1_9ASTR